jgi:hypothetical protein
MCGCALVNAVAPGEEVPNGGLFLAYVHVVPSSDSDPALVRRQSQYPQVFSDERVNIAYILAADRTSSLEQPFVNTVPMKRMPFACALAGMHVHNRGSRTLVPLLHRRRFADLR